ncbi:unnamed protein product [Caenorhabditis auriculariae]|uniref:Uncharacterized protein n=1 Tax=Caenorhabditis auriculariae TaxID=2777116 RepID=A0A8S1HLB2_9PELO|nr:unnamed protein product [Caenorhabditis auriculariae]
MAARSVEQWLAQYPAKPMMKMSFIWNAFAARTVVDVLLEELDGTNDQIRENEKKAQMIRDRINSQAESSRKLRDIQEKSAREQEKDARRAAQRLREFEKAQHEENMKEKFRLMDLQREEDRKANEEFMRKLDMQREWASDQETKNLQERLLISKRNQESVIQKEKELLKKHSEAMEERRKTTKMLDEEAEENRKKFREAEEAASAERKKEVREIDEVYTQNMNLMINQYQTLSLENLEARDKLLKEVEERQAVLNSQMKELVTVSFASAQDSHDARLLELIQEIQSCSNDLSFKVVALQKALEAEKLEKELENLRSKCVKLQSSLSNHSMRESLLESTKEINKAVRAVNDPIIGIIRIAKKREEVTIDEKTIGNLVGEINAKIAGMPEFYNKTHALNYILPR